MSAAEIPQRSCLVSAVGEFLNFKLLPYILTNPKLLPYILTNPMVHIQSISRPVFCRVDAVHPVRLSTLRIRGWTARWRRQ